MEIILWLPDAYPVLLTPTLEGVAAWLVFFTLLFLLLRQTVSYQVPLSNRSAIGMFLGLLLFQAAVTLLLGLRLPAGSALPLPNAVQEPRGPALMLLGSLPWMLAGGLLGPIAAAALGFIGGALRLWWDSQSIFPPLELALLASLFSVAVRQRYRTRSFSLLREPLFTALVLILIYTPVFIVDAFFVSSGSIAARLDYAIASAPYVIAAVAGELLIGGLFAQVLALSFPAPWGRRQALQPSPSERSLEVRFLFNTGAITVILLIALLAGDWVVAGAAAREMIKNRMKSTAEMAGYSVPFFLETGQNLALQISDLPAVESQSGEALNELLNAQMRAVPYFDQILLFDIEKTLIGRYPASSGVEQNLYPEEAIGLELAFGGVLSQTYSIPPLSPGGSARVSFIVAVSSSPNQLPERVIVARTNLETNPFSQPLLSSLKAVSEVGGEGILLDDNQRILYHPSPSMVMTSLAVAPSTESRFFDDTAPNGTRNLVYYQPVTGRSWSVVLTVPAQQAQQLAISIAAPLSAMILGLAVVALVSLRMGLRTVTNSLQNLASEAQRISQGQLDHSLTVHGVDEVGQLRRAFEQMRVSLQSRLEELNRLLLVSQGVASSLDMQDAIQPVMEAVLATGASAVRVVMPSLEEDAGQEQNHLYALGPSKEKYTYLDEQVYRLSQTQERLVLTNVARARGFELSAGKPQPASLIAVSLRHENRNYGVLWAAYDQTRLFAEADVSFLATLSGQAALAASNNHLFRTAEVGRQRLAAILASTPDPVLVTDQYNRLLLANPAAWQVLGAAVGTGEGKPIEKLISQASLLDLLTSTSADKVSAEVNLLNNQVYLATASPVLAEGHSVGRVCILRDVTHFKELDTMKTEFVNTVSHDLRSPLTLMRGYATMLEMVGALNEQQQGYVKKIIFGVENMARMVNNLLDLGRIEAGVGLQLETIPVPDMLERFVGALQLQASQKKIELSLQSSETSIPTIEADAALLQQAMYNLVENAIKYTPQGGRVTARLKFLPDVLSFEVEDNGIGIAPIDQPRLFEKFYRGGQREAREQKGSGLGLAIVRSIAERHGGKVWLESQLGRGSTFSLQIPLHQPKPPKEADAPRLS